MRDGDVSYEHERLSQKRELIWRLEQLSFPYIDTILADRFRHLRELNVVLQLATDIFMKNQSVQPANKKKGEKWSESSEIPHPARTTFCESRRLACLPESRCCSQDVASECWQKPYRKRNHKEAIGLTRCFNKTRLDVVERLVPFWESIDITADHADHSITYFHVASHPRVQDHRKNNGRC